LKKNENNKLKEIIFNIETEINNIKTNERERNHELKYKPTLTKTHKHNDICKGNIKKIKSQQKVAKQDVNINNNPKHHCNITHKLLK